MKPLRLLLFFAFLAVILLTSACNRDSGKPRVAFVSNNAATFWTIAEAGCREGEKKYGVEVVFRMPAKGDPAAQTEILDILRNQNIKALAVSVIDPKGQRAHLDEIAEKVPVITQDNDAPDSKRLCYIGTNNYKAGRAVGELVKEVMPDGGVVAVFVGQLEPLNARQRRQGMIDELTGAPELKNINEFTSSADAQTYGKYRVFKTYTDQPEGETQATRNALAAINELKDEKNVCFVGLWAYNPPTILTAVKDKVKEGVVQHGQVKIVGFDEDMATLQGIKDGQIYATVVQDPFNFGVESVRIMAALAKNDKSVLPPNGVIDVPHRVITKDGGKDRVAVEKFQQDLEKLIGKK